MVPTERSYHKKYSCEIALAFIVQIVISKVKVSERRTEWHNDKHNKPPDLRSRGHKNKNEITTAKTSKYLKPRNGYRPRSKSDRAIVRWMLLSAVGDCDCRVLHLSGRLCWCCCIWSQGLAASKLINRVFASMIYSFLPSFFFLLFTDLNARLGCRSSTAAIDGHCLPAWSFRVARLHIPFQYVLVSEMWSSWRSGTSGKFSLKNVLHSFGLHVRRMISVASGSAWRTCLAFPLVQQRHCWRQHHVSGCLLFF